MYGWMTFYHQGHEMANDSKGQMRDLQIRLQKVRAGMRPLASGVDGGERATVAHRVAERQRVSLRSGPTG